MLHVICHVPHVICHVTYHFMSHVHLSHVIRSWSCCHVTCHVCPLRGFGSGSGSGIGTGRLIYLVPWNRGLKTCTMSINMEWFELLQVSITNLLIKEPSETLELNCKSSTTQHVTRSFMQIQIYWENLFLPLTSTWAAAVLLVFHERGMENFELGHWYSIILFKSRNTE